MALAARTAATTLEAGMEPLIVAGDEEVTSWADRSGFQVVPDPGTGLNGAAGAGAGWCVERSLDWVVIHADLPLLQAADVASLLDALSTARGVIAPSSDGGTSALGVASGVPAFRYGTASFHRHLQALPDAVVVTRCGLLHDLDTPIDLESARRHPRGGWIDSLLE